MTINIDINFTQYKIKETNLILHEADEWRDNERYAATALSVEISR